MELSLLKKQNILKKKFNLDCSTKYEFIDKKKILASDKYKKLMIADYHIIGTYNPKSCIWRWAWGNTDIPCNLSQFSKKSLKLGEKLKNDNYMKTMVKMKTKSTAFKYMSNMSLLDKNIKGYIIYKKPVTGLLVYVLLKNPKHFSKKSKKA
tara:strand:- start:86 stop:538 length:453 start_codon:yes stop_codon:yes gene_type:complete